MYLTFPFPLLLVGVVFDLISSLATVSADGSTDMNIITYASPVGIRPVRKWVVSLYKKTLTHENLIGGFDHNKKPNVAVLQLLRKKHEPLVYPLGGQVSIKEYPLSHFQTMNHCCMLV